MPWTEAPLIPTFKYYLRLQTAGFQRILCLTCQTSRGFRAFRAGMRRSLPFGIRGKPFASLSAPQAKS